MQHQHHPLLRGHPRQAAHTRAGGWVGMFMGGIHAQKMTQVLWASAICAAIVDRTFAPARRTLWLDS
jgi:hypothetical protein